MASLRSTDGIEHAFATAGRANPGTNADKAVYANARGRCMGHGHR
ncbi:hypothetical protein [Cupriavidus sp. amp6]|nr:hypothetical protein [Cupriavidus sp. amp6]